MFQATGSCCNRHDLQEMGCGGPPAELWLRARGVLAAADFGISDHSHPTSQDVCPHQQHKRPRHSLKQRHRPTPTQHQTQRRYVQHHQSELYIVTGITLPETDVDYASLISGSMSMCGPPVLLRRAGMVAAAMRPGHTRS
jgi:hypothetical protein